MVRFYTECRYFSSRVMVIGLGRLLLQVFASFLGFTISVKDSTSFSCVKHKSISRARSTVRTDSGKGGSSTPIIYLRIWRVYIVRLADLFELNDSGQGQGGDNIACIVAQQRVHLHVLGNSGKPGGRVLRNNKPHVRIDLLVSGDAETNAIQVGSQAWFTWLDDHQGFIYESDAGHLTARRELRRGIELLVWLSPAGWQT